MRGQRQRVEGKKQREESVLRRNGFEHARMRIEANKDEK